MPQARTRYLLKIDGEDLLKLPRTGHLEYYENSLDKRIELQTILKYPNIEKLEDMTEEN